MSNIYNSLQSLLQSDSEAMEFYDSLPEIVREGISSRAGHVNTFEDLKAHAKTLINNI